MKCLLGVLGREGDLASVSQRSPVCVEERGGRLSYSCLERNGVNCGELLPKHCNIFFVPSEVSYPHSLTATGYGQDSDGNMFWTMKNSWGEDWGEGR